MGITFSYRSAGLAVPLPAGLFGCVSAKDTNQSALTIFAAVSLTRGTGDLDQVFKAAHPGVYVTSDFDSSATPKTRIKEGASSE